LRQACTACASWHPDLFISVNVSPVQLIRSDFIKTVEQALVQSGLKAYRLELEITESALVDKIDLVRQSLDRIRAMGVQIALDDFGAGYCGLHYLRKIEIDKIKIDKSVIDEAVDVAIARNILHGLTMLAKQMDIVLVAEGVDDIEKAEYLTRGEKVHQFQGHLFSTPVDARTAYLMQQALPRNTKADNVIPLPIRSNDW
jgi:EAL domain-containing protein (putative c-di-GMP-specific phosphodiesterase class I)